MAVRKSEGLQVYESVLNITSVEAERAHRARVFQSSPRISQESNKIFHTLAELRTRVPAPARAALNCFAKLPHLLNPLLVEPPTHFIKMDWYYLHSALLPTPDGSPADEGIRYQNSYGLFPALAEPSKTRSHIVAIPSPATVAKNLSSTRKLDTRQGEELSVFSHWEEYKTLLAAYQASWTACKPGQNPYWFARTVRLSRVGSETTAQVVQVHGKGKAHNPMVRASFRGFACIPNAFLAPDLPLASRMVWFGCTPLMHQPPALALPYARLRTSPACIPLASHLPTLFHQPSHRKFEVNRHGIFPPGSNELIPILLPNVEKATWLAGGLERLEAYFVTKRLNIGVKRVLHLNFIYVFDWIWHNHRGHGSKMNDSASFIITSATQTTPDLNSVTHLPLFRPENIWRNFDTETTGGIPKYVQPSAFILDSYIFCIKYVSRDRAPIK
ncbi:uncharacterized protein BDR25DRAFT_360311 [Lindgomyces ingoldianus]|uniref:Uncharacterized protein n=1 Tax=Lindgomyces ingoldianus TaxID=673940 RepID=A0ACB6QFP0_9PLEO|nr:uncharacterized protein BDR25DRAFT_360311 [Lindgomyces ingoldianus]KAF2465783.1 hypothetical protein BDR25DRAFT_360311 [Lindgomyces ingoldianus]